MFLFDAKSIVKKNFSGLGHLKKPRITRKRALIDLNIYNKTNLRNVFKEVLLRIRTLQNTYGYTTLF